MTSDDVSDLSKVISSSGKSAKMWCTVLKMADDVCNRVGRLHLEDQWLAAADAYSKTENPCWEVIVGALCKYFNQKGPAKKLSQKYNIDFARVCN